MGSKAKNRRDREGIVYSTNDDFNYQYRHPEECETLPVANQNLKVTLDKSGRAGRQVTLVVGFVGKQGDLEVLTKLLKARCGSGGSAKDGEILIQGDVRDKVVAILQKEGYRAS